MPTKHRGPERETQALDAYITLMRAAESATARIHRHLRDVKLTMGQFGVLEALYHLGSMNQGDIARKLLRTAGNITTVLDNLEKRGLTRRDRTSADRRCVTVSLSVEGERLIRRIFPRHAEAVADEMAVLSAGEQEALRRLCRKLGRA